MFKNFLLIISLAVSTTFAYKDVSADSLQSWITAGAPFDFLLIDIRDTSELENVIASDTVRPYHMSWNESVLADSAHLLPIDVAVVLYCRSGNRSAQASALLSGQGLVIYNLLGGFSGWDGPTMSGESLAPLSQMPAPTMRAGSSSAWFPQMSRRPGASVSFTYMAGGVQARLNGERPSRSHVLEIFKTNGASVVRVQNPFKETQAVTIPLERTGRVYPVLNISGE